jgi:hypothetical protein
MGRLRNAAGTPSAQRIRLIQGYRNGLPALVKNRRREGQAGIREGRFPAGEASLQRHSADHHKAGIWREWAEFVLNAPLSSVICH